MHSGIIGSQSDDMLVVNTKDGAGQEYLDEYVDDVTGEPLLRDLVMEACNAEMETCTQKDLSECVRVTSKQQIGGKLIDVNQGDSRDPNSKSRLAAQEIKRDNNEDMFAARHWRRSGPDEKPAIAPWCAIRW